MQLKEHQINCARQALSVFTRKHTVYVFGPPRVGKSLIALEIAVKGGYTHPLVLTKKAAIKGWEQYSNSYFFTVTNYEQIKKLDQDEYDCIILDEAHNFSAFPRPSQRMKDTRAFCKGKPIIYLSGTPVVEGYYKLYSQFAMCTFGPLSGLGPYDFFRKYGIPHKRWIYGREIEMYDTFKDEVLQEIFNPYIVKVTFEDAGLAYSNYDKPIFLKDFHLGILSSEVRLRQMINGKALENIPMVNQCLHRICGGIYDGDIVSRTKLDWVKTQVQTNKKIAVMAYFREEQELLQSIKGIDVYSSTKYCEGVDLSRYDVFILYSFGYSGAKFVQLRDRIVNINKNQKTEVLIPLIEKGLDSKIYEIVKNKKNFNTSKLYDA